MLIPDVLDEGRLVDILFERDIVIALSRHDGRVPDMTAQGLMTFARYRNVRFIFDPNE